ncbi:JAB domain-containing protein [Sphingobium sp.]|uniref:JAB domain-containing protein n=1 Tax=Sphingobium sp. TaxID=1912891 RepID=UPI0026058FF0|nr:JAB domain-containing protein [Sphingobium sp.]
MMQGHGLTIAILDHQWRPRHAHPMEDGWRGLIDRALADEARWLALIQRRRADCPALPRSADISLTRALARHLRALDLRLADHVIHAGPARFSFRAAGLL